jgi:hypothetical protein
MKESDVYTARIGKPNEIPAFAKIGDKFADGYILNISDNQVKSRKTHEWGISLGHVKSCSQFPGHHNPLQFADWSIRKA